MMHSKKKSSVFRRAGKPANIVTTAVFAAVLFSISLGSVLTPDKEFSETENRTLQSTPQFSFSRLFEGKFTSEFESYVQDQFLLRDSWIYAKNLCELAMQKNEINGIFICADGYYIEDHEKSSYTSELAMNNISAVAQFAEKYSDLLGAEHVSVMLAPTAQSVLRDKLPPLADPYDQNEFISKLADLLPEGIFVDVNGVLCEHSDEEIYYRTDHHWTTYGAYLAYTCWAESKGYTVNPPDYYDREVLTDEFLGTVNSKLNLPMTADTVTAYISPNSSYRLSYDGGVKTSDSLLDRSFLSGKDKYGVFLGGNAGIVQIDTENKNGRRLVIFKDSYANCFIPLIADEFEQVYVVDLRYYNTSASQLIEETGATDIAVLYNADSAATDMNLRKITG